MFPDKTASYFVYNPNISQATRLDYYTDAEVLFGGHKIYDWLAKADLVINYGIPIVTSLLTTISPTLSAVLTVAELCKVAYFSAAVNDTLSSGVSSGIDEYLQGFIKEKDPNNPDAIDYRESFSKAFGWIMFVLDLGMTILEGESAFNPSLSDIIIYEKVNSSVDYRVTIGPDGASLTMQELVDYCNQ